MRFTGLFGGEKILWDAHIMTLEAVLAQALENGDPPPVTPHQFIDIGTDEADGRLIRIGLRLAVIDEPSVWKTITMIRNYQRLRVGRIEWGGRTSDRLPPFPT